MRPVQGGLGYTATCYVVYPPSFLIPADCSGNLSEEYEVLVCIREYLDRDDGEWECRVATLGELSVVGYATQCKVREEGEPDDEEASVNEENVYGVGPSRITAHSKTPPSHPAGRGLPLR